MLHASVVSVSAGSFQHIFPFDDRMNVINSERISMLHASVVSVSASSVLSIASTAVTDPQNRIAGVAFFVACSQWLGTLGGQVAC